MHVIDPAPFTDSALFNVGRIVMYALFGAYLLAVVFERVKLRVAVTALFIYVAGSVLLLDIWEGGTRNVTAAPAEVIADLQATSDLAQLDVASAALTK